MRKEKERKDGRRRTGNQKHIRRNYINEETKLKGRITKKLQLKGHEEKCRHDLNQGGEEDITQEEVESQIRRRKKKKTAGEDKIQNEIWRYYNS